MKVKKRVLLLFAGIVWLIAGFNVLRIGIICYKEYKTFLNFFISFLVFLIFQIFIFSRLVKKHTRRIHSYENEKQFFLNFFDLKSFIIMVIMISGGIIIRSFNLAPEIFIATFYTGLGASLMLAGILFTFEFIRFNIYI